MGAAQKLLTSAVVLALAASCGGSQRRERPGPIDIALESVDGGEVSLSAHLGKIVVLHVFGTWAPAAHADADQLIELHRQNSRDVAVIGIALDAEGRRFVAPWRAALGAPYTLALADDAVRRGDSALGRIVEVPTTFLIDRSGRIAARIERGLAPGELARLVAALVKE